MAGVRKYLAFSAIAAALYLIWWVYRAHITRQKLQLGVVVVSSVFGASLSDAIHSALLWTAGVRAVETLDVLTTSGVVRPPLFKLLFGNSSAIDDLASRVHDPTVHSSIQAAAERLRTIDHCTCIVGVGFSIGGMHLLQMAGHSNCAVDVVVAASPVLFVPNTNPTRTNVTVERATVPTLLVMGDADTHLLSGTLQRARAAVGRLVHLIVFPGAQHAFALPFVADLVPNVPMWRPWFWAQFWSQTLHFIDTHCTALKRLA